MALKSSPAPNFEGFDPRTADGLIEFFKRELSVDNRGKNFCYYHLMPSEIERRREVLRKIHLVVSRPVMTTARIKKDILPVLKTIQAQNLEDYGTQYVLVEAHMALNEFSGGKHACKWIVPSLMTFLENEEGEVRKIALASIRELVKRLNAAESNKIFTDNVQATFRSLAKSPSYQGRESACHIIDIFYAFASDAIRAELKDALVWLVYDESLFVQQISVEVLKSVVSNSTLQSLKEDVSVPDVAPQSDDHTFLNLAVYLPFSNTLHMTQKVHFLQVIFEACKILNDVEEAAGYLQASVCDTSVLVRLELIKLLPSFMTIFARHNPSYVKDFFLPTFQNFLKDPSVDVQVATCLAIHTLLEPSPSRFEIEHLLSENYKRKLPYEASIERRLAPAEVEEFIEPLVKKCSEGDLVVRARVRGEVMDMMDRLVSNCSENTVRVVLYPVLVHHLLITDNHADPIEYITGLLQIPAFYEKLKLTSFDNELGEALYCLHGRDKNKENKFKGIDPDHLGMCRHVNWRIRCGCAQLVPILAKDFNKKDPILRDQVKNILKSFFHDDVASVREMSFRSGAEMARVFGDDYFYRTLLPEIVEDLGIDKLRYAHDKPPKGTIIFNWRHACKIIEFAAPIVTSLHPIALEVLEKSLMQEVRAVRIAAVQAVLALKNNPVLKDSMREAQCTKSALTLSSMYCERANITHSERDLEVIRLSNELCEWWRFDQ